MAGPAVAGGDPERGCLSPRETGRPPPGTRDRACDAHGEVSPCQRLGGRPAARPLWPLVGMTVRWPRALLPRGLFWKWVERVRVQELCNEKVPEGQIEGLG